MQVVHKQVYKTKFSGVIENMTHRVCVYREALQMTDIAAESVE